MGELEHHAKMRNEGAAPPKMTREVEGQQRRDEEAAADATDRGMGELEHHAKMRNEGDAPPTKNVEKKNPEDTAKPLCRS
ncbi:MAG: hypothetical protein WA188_00045 [Terriglobales bacterium]